MDPDKRDISFMNPASLPLVFSSGNEHKIREINALLGSSYSLSGLKDLNILDDIEETGKTFRENSRIKAEYVFIKTGLDVFADDSGLEVEALQGEPGIYSARYAGNRDMRENLNLVLKKMEGEENRKARFNATLCLFFQGKVHYFEGFLEGHILEAPRGDQGFGYDPIFQPLGFWQSLAELSLEQKNQISHRARALDQMKAFLENTRHF